MHVNCICDYPVSLAPLSARTGVSCDSSERPARRAGLDFERSRTAQREVRAVAHRNHGCDAREGMQI